MNPAELLELSRLLNQLGKEIELDAKEMQPYLPDISNDQDMRDFYLPKVSKNFYYNPDIFRSLVTPNLRRLRR